MWFYPIRYEWNRLGKIVFVALVLYAVGTLVRTGTLAGDLSVKMIAIAAFPFLLYVLQFYSDRELTTLRVTARSCWTRLRSR